MNAEPTLPQVWRVAARVQETADTATLTIEPPAPFRFAPGQFNMLYVFGHGEAPISISGDPADARVLVHTIRGVGAVTRPMLKLEPGASIGVRGPYGSAWPLGQARGADVIVVAGGLGLAPLRPAILAILNQRADHGRLTLICGARDPEGLLFRPDLARWRERADFDLHLTVDSADPDWHGEVGTVLRQIKQLTPDPSAIALVCGPEIMMRLAAGALRERGLPEARIYVSLERNMKCALARCGHCQFGPHFLCADGPVFRYDQLRPLLGVAEL